MNNDTKQTTADKDAVQPTASDTVATAEKQGFFGKLADKCMNAYNYVMDGVWKDPRSNIKVRIVKILNLTMSAFFNSSLQIRSMALTYSTVLSVVPLLALLVAIGRGFGLQEIIQTELYKIFPSQAQSIGTALQFVDSYLSTAAQGVFVGVGIVVLLWTVISLLSYIEDTFNTIWGVQTQRTMYQKLTDYIAICLIIPVLLICSSGISVFMSSIIQDNFNVPILAPVFNWTLEIAAPLVLAWLAFTLSYYLIPNTKVEFKYAAISGALAAIAFQVLQMLFLNGQIYVSKYNAIYGSFAFLPLLLVWLQFVWVITLAGGVLCFSSQNIFEFSFTNEINRISANYKWRLTLAVMTIAVDRFNDEKPPLTPHQMAVEYGLPITLVNDAAHKLIEAGLLQRVVVTHSEDETGLSPAIDPSLITVGTVLERLGAVGSANFIPQFNDRFQELGDAVLELRKECIAAGSKILLSKLKIIPVTNHKP